MTSSKWTEMETVNRFWTDDKQLGVGVGGGGTATEQERCLKER